MESIKQIADRLNLSPETVAQKLRDRGIDPDAISADKVDDMVAFLGGGALTTGSSAKPATRKPGRPRKTEDKNSIAAGLTNAAQVTQSEVSAFVEQIKQGKVAYKKAVVSEVVTLLRELPTEIVNEVGVSLQGEVADTETFRQEGTRWADALFQTGFLDPTE